MAPFARLIGYDLLDWQVSQLADWSATRPDGTWVHMSCGSSIPRQAGKSVAGIVWTAFLASALGYKVLWTDHNYSTTMEMLERFRDIFGTRPGDSRRGIRALNRRVAETSNKTAQEWYRFKNGGAIQFSTRTKSSKLGFSFDVVVYDEAQELTDAHMQVILPTTTSGAMHNPQTLYLGTPTRAGSVAETFQRVREQAWEDGDDARDLCWLEYGVDEVGDVSDESRWYGANPSLGHHADIKAIRMAKSKLTELAFAQEYLGYWLPKVADAVLSPGEWDACRVDADAAPVKGRVAYGVKFSPDGSEVALAAAVAPPDGPAHVELVRAAPMSRGTAWLAEWLASRADRGSCAAIDGLSGAGALLDRLAGRVPRRYAVGVRSPAAIAAAAMMLDAVRSGSVTHMAQPALDASATRATRRRIGSAGGWGWGGEGSCAIEAASLALWAVRTTKRDPSRKARVHA